jgi:hypothetical protein
MFCVEIHWRDSGSFGLSMESTYPELAVNIQEPGASLADILLEIRTTSESWNNRKFKRSTTKRVEPSICASEFQHCAAGRPGTAHLPVSPTVFDAETSKMAQKVHQRHGSRLQILQKYRERQQRGGRKIQPDSEDAWGTAEDD